MPSGLDHETLALTLEAIREFARERLPEAKRLQLDHDDVFPLDLVREMCGSGLGIQLLFLGEEHGGMGGGAFDVYRICELMGRIDLGVATGVLATFLGSDPIHFGGTPEQRAHWLRRIADEGLLMAYCATEPAAGSDLAALRSTATPVQENGRVVGYTLNGVKQWISNGGYADAYSVLALAPGGPSWFVVDQGAEGLAPGQPEDKHGIRSSNTAAVSFDDVYVEADRLVGGVEGQGLVQAQLVFGYTRLMVAAFGLGAGWEAIDRAIAYSKERIQAGSPLAEKPGYTHKLIVPHAARLEAARAIVEETAERIDAGEGSLNTEGAIAKLLAMFPKEGLNEKIINRFNSEMAFNYDDVKDFLIAHYKVTEREDTPFWKYVKYMEIPDSLQEKLEIFRSRGEIMVRHEELFKETSWFAVLAGQGLMPESYHPVADAISEDELRLRLTKIRTGVSTESTA